MSDILFSVFLNTCFYFATLQILQDGFHFSKLKSYLLGSLLMISYAGLRYKP